MSDTHADCHPVGTLVDMLKKRRTIDPESCALWIDNQRPMTYRALLSKVDQLADRLRDAGALETTRIAFPMARGAAGLVGFLAASSVGICCPLDIKLRDEEMDSAVRVLNPSIVLYVDRRDASESAAFGRFGLPRVGFELESLAGDDDRHQIVYPAGSETRIAIMMQTSGTTSKPKIVGLTHANVAAAAMAIGDAFGLGQADVCLTPMPLHHVHGLISAAMSSLFAGSSIRCLESFLPSMFDEAYRNLQPTWFTASPAAHLSLRDFYRNAFAPPPRDRLRFFRASSAPLPPSTIAELEAIFGVPLIETYGLTESASMICSNPLPPMRRKFGSVGIPFGAQIRIADARGQTCGTDVEGEILIRGPSVIRQYVGDDVSLRDAFWGDWLRTGDIGRIDRDGYFYVCGRIKELIKRGGHSVFPTEIDDVLCQHDQVAEAVTFSVEHATQGEDVVAAVVTRAQACVSENALRAFVGARLSAFKVPSVILLVDSIPKNAMGKAVRRDMRRHFADRLSPLSRPPVGSIEGILLSVWQDVLGRGDIGVTDNVFLFGGDPLNAEKVLNALEQHALWSTATVKTLIAFPTVREQALQCAADPAHADNVLLHGDNR
ncbi:non-ribosomal peptide synthetase [Pararobbsia silviterrae]|uniref:AMP-dependent synthetase n=1 Tax=Pararobbsia silviterrae TaxID=1792498 RepID=A0A494X6E0_9BURK|nr:non-ribosomal peptide synthetase [Pararobbsia silviterrae]RKP43549.1 AMP-dependent synthetase [Pararobbsia silviterrae]